MAFRLAAPGPGNCGSTWASSGHGYSIPSGTDLILVTLVLTLASSVPCDSGSPWTSPVSGNSDPKHGLTSPGDCGFHRYLTWTSCLRSHLGLTRTWCLWYPPGYHQDMVTLFTHSDPAGPINSGLHLDMVTLGPTWVSTAHGESDPHLVLTCNW